MLATVHHRTVPGERQLLSVTTLPRTKPGHVVVEVVGEVDAYTAPAVDGCLHSQTVQRGVRELVVDLAQVTFLGGAGVTVLARAQQRCRMHGVRFVLRRGGRRTVLRALQLTGLAAVVAIETGEVEPDLHRRPAAHPRIPVRSTPSRRPQRVCW